MGIFKVNQKKLEEVIKIAIKLLKEGKVLVCPTDTVYGLIADATNKEAVEKLFKIKRRPKEKPVPIFVKDIEMAKRLAIINEYQEKFLTKIWFTRPNFGKTWAGKGKITVVLKRKKGIKLFGVAPKTIGLRIPNYKLINVLLLKINKPLTGTSANISGKKATTKIKEVLKQFKYSGGPIRIPRGRRPRVGLFACPDLILDAGNLKKSLPSTIINFTKKKPKILRRGGLKISNFPPASASSAGEWRAGKL